LEFAKRRVYFLIFIETDEFSQYLKRVLIKKGLHMLKLKSPWIRALAKIDYPEISKDAKTDVVVIGAGIAGCTTAYYLLKDTKKKVILLEASKIAHGATGHNAGQIASYFERPLTSLVQEFGFKAATNAQLDVLSAWDLLDHIVAMAQIKNKPESFAGYAAISTIPKLLAHFENQLIRLKANIRMDFAYVLNDPRVLRKIPKKYAGLYSVVSQEEIQQKTESKQKHIAALTVRKGVLNSALFCQELIEFLRSKYPKRFSVHEHTPVSTVFIRGSTFDVDTMEYTIKTSQVVLCTNGFRQVKIVHPTKKIKQLAEFLHGEVGHMAAYLDKKKDPFAISYLEKSMNNYTDPYFYVTRRNYSPKRSLVGIGGPEYRLDNVEKYERDRVYCPKAGSQIREFLKRTYGLGGRIPLHYQWEGLMGYTKTRIRCVGSHPQFRNLLFNLGCNGVGILPSIYGSKRISLIIQGIKLKQSIFDPKFTLAKR